jgi:hypothetical protein
LTEGSHDTAITSVTTDTPSQETFPPSDAFAIGPHSLAVSFDTLNTPNPGYLFGLLFSSLRSTRLTTAEAYSIASDLAEYVLQAAERVRNLGISMCYSLTADYERWPVVQWNEGDVEVLRLYHLEDSSCSWLTHYGLGKHWTPAGKNWLQASVSWSVRNRRSLRSLFVASQHLKESLRLSSDILNEQEKSSLFPQIKSVSFSGVC